MYPFAGKLVTAQRRVMAIRIRHEGLRGVEFCALVCTVMREGQILLSQILGAL